MNGYAIVRCKPFLVLLFSLICTSLIAQTHLERISKAERSDGFGYVVRFHFSEPIDSFTVIQPASDLIQLQLYSQNIDTSGLQMPAEAGKIQEIRLYKMPDSYGVDVYLDPDVLVISDAYTDGYSNDVLLALTKAEQYDVDVFTQQFLAKNWYLNINPEDALEIAPIAINPDNSFQEIAGKLKFDTIVIDAGHGGKDPGSIGYRNVKEKDIALAIALKLGEYIEELLPDIEVVYTRDDDTFIDLFERGPIANRAEGDLFVSIHTNSFHHPSASGAEVWFMGLNRTQSSLEIMKRENTVFNNGESEVHELSEEELLIYELNHSGYIATSEKIAGMLDHQFKNRANRRTRGVKQAGLVVLYTASMPAILVETGFITNPSEQRFLTSEYGQSIIASAIYRAIRDYKVLYEQSMEGGELTTSQE